ncbi:MAG TPA: VWA domain-containing protein [Pyrinomonadaceae bacterium]|jgi:Ca-activated chloride channel family protein|nr:VWA domain-containing protein [Pyrinomonadaceae bacterium]
MRRPTAPKRRARIRTSLLAVASCVSLFAAAPPAAQRAQQPQDDEVMSVNTDLVVLNVTAVDAKGDYVHGLKRADFKVFEDGREQQLTNFGVEETPFAAALLLDISGSMEGRVMLARSAAIRFLDGLRDDDVAAVYSFHTKVEQVQEFSHARDLAPRAFGLNAKGMTVLNDAITRAAGDLARRPEKRRAILVLSDGADNLSSASADKALAAALAANVTIYTVDMSDRASGPTPSPAALKNFSSKSGGRYVSTPGGKELREAFAEIVEELSNQYTLGYRPSNHERDGRWRTVEVKVAQPDVRARTRRGYRLSKP